MNNRYFIIIDSYSMWKELPQYNLFDCKITLHSGNRVTRLVVELTVEEVTFLQLKYDIKIQNRLNDINFVFLDVTSDKISILNELRPLQLSDAYKECNL